MRFAYARPERTANDTDRWLGDRQISGWLKAVFERCHNRSRLLKKLLRLGRGVGQGNILLVSCLSLQLLVKIGHLNAVILRARSSHCLLAEFFVDLLDDKIVATFDRAPCQMVEQSDHEPADRRTRT